MISQQAIPTFDQLDDNARLWPYGFATFLTPKQTETLQTSLQKFLLSWRSHGSPVQCAGQILEQKIVLIAGDVPGDNVSGCGIDASVRILKTFKEETGQDAMDFGLIHYRDVQGLIQSISRPAFKNLLHGGEITESTPVFDFSITTVGQLRQGQLEKPFVLSWHSKAFPLPV